MQKSISSIKEQTFKDYEVWVIDGGSSIETQNYLNDLEKPFFYQSRVDKGIYDAMNRGISLAKGDWLYFLGAGDILYNKNVFEDIFKSVSKKKESIIAGKIIYSGPTKPFIYSKHKMIKNIHWSKRMWLANGLHHQGTFYARALFKNRDYNLNYKTLADYHFNLKLFKDNIRCNILNLIIAECNSDGVSKTGDWEIYKEEVNLKTIESSPFLKPFFYIIAFTKFLSRKIVND